MKRSGFTPGNVAGAVLLLMFFVFLYIGFQLAPNPGRLINYGVGPQWECVHVAGSSALNCVRRPPGKGSS
ncbi:MAG: hypothetical protein ABSG83_10270 [Roseiarcus sp.]|jgi:hypothetical protein